MKNFNQIDCLELTPAESQQIEGGTEKSSSNFWNDISLIGASIVKGLVVFSTEGSKNAEICVK